MRHALSIGATVVYALAIVAFVFWAAHPHRAQPLVTAAPAVNGNTLADQIAERVAPQLLEFANDQGDMRDMVVVITGADNSSRLMTLSRTATPPAALYRVGAELLTQGAEHLTPAPPAANPEDHAL